MRGAKFFEKIMKIEIKTKQKKPTKKQRKKEEKTTPSQKNKKKKTKKNKQTIACLIIYRIWNIDKYRLDQL